MIFFFLFSIQHKAVRPANWYWNRRNFRARKILYSITLADFRTRKIFKLQGRCHMHTLVNVYGFSMLQNFVRSAISVKNTKLNCVRKFLQLQYAEPISRYAEIVEIFVVLFFCSKYDI